MDLPLLASPEHLERLRDQLLAAARQTGQISARLDALAIDDRWRGPAHRSFIAATGRLGGQCAQISNRLAADAARTDALAGRLSAELATLHRLEHEVLGAISRLAHRATHDVTGAAQSLLDSVRSRLPAHGSPGWRGLASTLLDGPW